MSDVVTWKPVMLDGWTEYEASDTGRIRNTNTGRILSPKYGRYQMVVKLVGRDAGGRRLFKGERVHRMVAAAWLGPCLENHVVDHIDNDRQNNRPDNLHYVLQMENVRKAVRQDRAGRKLTIESVRAIRTAFDGNRSQLKILAAQFGVSRQNVALIVDRKIWKDV